VIELAGAAAGEIAARGAVVRHEQRIANEHGIADEIADAGGRMAGRVHDLASSPPMAKRSPSAKRRSNCRSVGLEIRGVEDRLEEALDVADGAADSREAARLLLR